MPRCLQFYLQSFTFLCSCLSLVWGQVTTNDSVICFRVGYIYSLSQFFMRSSDFLLTIVTRIICLLLSVHLYINVHINVAVSCQFQNDYFVEMLEFLILSYLNLQLYVSSKFLFIAWLLFIILFQVIFAFDLFQLGNIYAVMLGVTCLLGLNMCQLNMCYVGLFQGLMGVCANSMGVCKNSMSQWIPNFLQLIWFVVIIFLYLVIML
eukprot:TRINITY_DN7524_c0_g1_i4.p1 TRINITY_DN7524_c0_g1~~TRINITY_DN7524_c0_g1_i4.p1  ORF type:complete len:207 (-),score=-15.31 TRINITY_DN7524_c0_g1_i4:148-768(-)